MKKKTVVLLLVIGLLLVVVSIAWFAVAVVNYRSGSVGIIGGADGPTLRFILRLLFPEISKTIPFRLGVFGIILVLTGAVTALATRKRL